MSRQGSPDLGVMMEGEETTTTRTREPSPEPSPEPSTPLEPSTTTQEQYPSSWSNDSTTPPPQPLDEPYSAEFDPPPHAPPPPPIYDYSTTVMIAPVLTEYLEHNFVPSVVPQPEEYQAKEQARQYLEKLVNQVSPGAKLLPFGSMANGFALKNSDMDLCCFLGKDAPVRAPSELVELLGTLIERETNFYVKMLPRARIPIIKLTMPPTPAVPAGMACDIGFENRLALENTRLLLTYAMIDPRLRTLVLFLKVWTKRRKINNPYRGTLSSYGYVLLVIHFLSHVKQPPVVPNLQRLPLPTTTPLEDLTYEGHDISFFDDLDLLPTVFDPLNVESTGELLIDFFHYFSETFDYNGSVISIRSAEGTLRKEEKGWQTDVEFDPEMIVRDLHKLCIEDPFALDYNVARTVTKDGLYTIQGEFTRAHKILTSHTSTMPQQAEQVTAIINELCAEREEFLLMHPPTQFQHPSPQPHHQNHHHHHHSNPPPPSSSSTHLSPVPPPKSPRRRSQQPSPQHRPTPSPQHPLPTAPIGPSPQPSYQHGNQSTSTSTSSRDHTLWQAAMGNGGGGVVPGGSGGSSEHGGEQHLDPNHSRHNQHHQQQYQHHHVPPPRRPYQPTSSSPYQQHPSMNHQHLAPSPVVTAPSSVASSTVGGGTSSSSSSTLDRRSSWDGSGERSLAGEASNSTTNGNRSQGEKRPVASTSTATTTTTTNTATVGYDLHRFFQNPPSSSSSSSMSDVGVPTGPNSHHHHHPRTTVSLTAPPSPDLTPTSLYSSGHLYGNGSGSGGGYPGRTPYRYASSGYPVSSSHHGPRHTSVPRNAHAVHHASYAAAVPSSGYASTHPYPLGSSTSTSRPYPSYPVSASSSSSSTTTTPNLASTTTTTASGTTTISPGPAPVPIFPAEDRERIARASSITFGNFPELLPLPSYAHYHASGGSAAYLSGSGGWGVNPYGMGGGGGGGVLSRRGSESGYEQRARVRRSFGLSGEENEDVEEEEEDEELDVGIGAFSQERDFIDSRGRRPPPPPVVNGSSYPLPLEHLEHVMNVVPQDHRHSRVRGRSVPHTRMGPDGRESILFGAIEVTLPKPEDVEAAEREEEEKERGTTTSEEEETVETEEGERDRGELEEEEREIANLGPSTESTSEAPTTVDIPPKSIESIPELTTSPPTPAKTPIAVVRPPLPSYASRPLSPLFNSTTVISPPASPFEQDDLDKTPRPASPVPLPSLSNGTGFDSPPRIPFSNSSSRRSSSAASSSSPNDSPRTGLNGISGLSLEGEGEGVEGGEPPQPPPRSSKAAKRARQKERKRERSVASSLEGSPLASPPTSGLQEVV